MNGEKLHNCSLHLSLFAPNVNRAKWVIHDPVTHQLPRFSKNGRFYTRIGQLNMYFASTISIMLPSVVVLPSFSGNSVAEFSSDVIFANYSPQVMGVTLILPTQISCFFFNFKILPSSCASQISSLRNTQSTCNCNFTASQPG
jgi:hypothetical protein